MAFAKLVLENPNTGFMRVAPVGFSWTCFFFGFLPPLFRGDWKWFFIMLICAVLTWGFSGIVFIFIYNKLYIKDLIQNGYKVKAIEKSTIEYASLKLGINLPLLVPDQPSTTNVVAA